jgi:hypothetical protein
MKASTFVLYVIINYLILIFSLNTSHAEHLPDAEKFSNEYQNDLLKSMINKETKYPLRTKHLDKNNQPLYTNRLIFEESPYLLQHAHNPVNWYSWSDEAFALAKKLNKPIFLSIGYSTCHWCHVMERESFDDIEIARYLNENFIAIKVDRERRPDVDRLYMTAVELIKGSGGWPISSFLLANGHPFYSEIYLPPDQFLSLLKNITHTWEHEQEKIILSANELSIAVHEKMKIRNEVTTIDESVLRKGSENIMHRYDPLNGGFDGPIKFPNETNLLFLLQMVERKGNEEILTVVEYTLEKMAQGGIYDHIGGGFHRYSTDAEWQIPHFEKMLYNQANLARVYLYAYRLTGKQLYRRISEQILDYVLDDMTSPEGVYYSATDADSEEIEGAYFIWSSDEIKSLLNPEDTKLVFEYFGITNAGNFNGKNVLFMPVSHEKFEVKKSRANNLSERIEFIRAKLKKIRDKRSKPLRDDKIIVVWNGFIITALAKASQVLKKDDYLVAAKRSAEYLWDKQVTADHQLWRVNLNGNVSILAAQEDYASFSEAMIALYDVTGEQVWLDRATLLTDAMIDKFWDSEGSFFRMGAEESLFIQPIDIYDHAIPSGNSIAMHVLIKLSQRVFNYQYQDYVSQMLNSFSFNIDKRPDSYPYMLSAIDEYINGISGSIDYAGRGSIKIKSQFQGSNNTLRIKLKIASDWHINSNKPLQDYLIPMKLTITDGNENWALSNVKYPEPTIKKLNFENEILTLYEGTIMLTANLWSRSNRNSSNFKKLDLQLQLQACNNDLCLPPEEVKLEFAVLEGNHNN